MTGTAGASRGARTGDRRLGRAGVDETALRLFAEHGVAGTSLQMIADAMGVTKAAVYYHYKTKDDLVLGVLAPVFAEVRRVVERAQTQRSRSARVDTLVTGLIGIVVEQGPRYGVFNGDLYVAELASKDPWLQSAGPLVTELLLGPDPDTAGLVTASMFFASLTGPLRDPVLSGLPPEQLRAAMLDGAHRLLRIPRRPAGRPPGADPGESA
ncbi:TetR/AcrR family transcriptional regulator [Motilibacter aurantiacus]|uniref:TetR/AcrR family transcriptional regulator n=1 Tax=Motilibacter aurantiacus TaxID=2714955 RepID=UPI00140DA0FF|nr:TetR/AcrR family transcriptional regulator [Motilibacter aurantiacus]NHC44259.1 TetR/AcrR family transcriptional regulator [Motilibacter aurantiacus]